MNITHMPLLLTPPSYIGASKKCGQSSAHHWVMAMGSEVAQLEMRNHQHVHVCDVVAASAVMQRAAIVRL